MAITFVGGVCNLVAKLLARTLILGDHFASAGAVAVPSFQRLLQALHQFLVFVQADFHTLLLALGILSISYFARQNQEGKTLSAKFCFCGKNW